MRKIKVFQSFDRFNVSFRKYLKHDIPPEEELVVVIVTGCGRVRGDVLVDRIKSGETQDRLRIIVENNSAVYYILPVDFKITTKCWL